MTRTILLLLAASVGGAGCVQYTPIELSAIPPSQDVRVSVTNEGALRLARYMGRIAPDVTGSVAPVSGDSIAVTIWLGKDYRGTPFENVRQTVVLPREEVTALRLRKLSGWRTAAMSVAALAGTLVLADQISQIGDPNRSDGEDVGPPPADVILFRILPGWKP